MPSKKANSVQDRTMADGLNEARAMRVAEVMNDFQMLQRYIMQPQPTPSVADYYEEGYAILRKCQEGARSLLSAQYDQDLQPTPGAPGEVEKRQLQRILVDASARRFQAQKLYLRTAAANRWVNLRHRILQGRGQQPSHSAALQQADNALRVEIAAITNERIVNDLHTKDCQAGHWLQEDPPLPVLLDWIRSH